MLYPNTGTKALVIFCLGLFLSSNLMAKDLSLKDLEASCESGDAQSCIDAGTAYSRGELYSKKIKKNKVKSQRLIKKGSRMAEQNCQRGNFKQCYVIGVMYFEGEVIPADFPRGLEMLQRSCSGGYEEACIWLKNSGVHFTIE